MRGDRLVFPTGASCESDTEPSAGTTPLEGIALKGIGRRGMRLW